MKPEDENGFLNPNQISEEILENWMGLLAENQRTNNPETFNDLSSEVEDPEQVLNQREVKEENNNVSDEEKNERSEKEKRIYNQAYNTVCALGGGTYRNILGDSFEKFANGLINWTEESIFTIQNQITEVFKNVSTNNANIRDALVLIFDNCNSLEAATIMSTAKDMLMLDFYLSKDAVPNGIKDDFEVTYTLIDKKEEFEMNQESEKAREWLYVIINSDDSPEVVGAKDKINQKEDYQNELDNRIGPEGIEELNRNAAIAREDVRKGIILDFDIDQYIIEKSREELIKPKDSFKKSEILDKIALLESVKSSTEGKEKYKSILLDEYAKLLGMEKYDSKKIHKLLVKNGRDEKFVKNSRMLLSLNKEFKRHFLTTGSNIRKNISNVIHGETLHEALLNVKSKEALRELITKFLVDDPTSIQNLKTIFADARDRNLGKLPDDLKEVVEVFNEVEVNFLKSKIDIELFGNGKNRKFTSIALMSAFPPEDILKYKDIIQDNLKELGIMLPPNQSLVEFLKNDNFSDFYENYVKQHSVELQLPRTLDEFMIDATLIVYKEENYMENEYIDRARRTVSFMDKVSNSTNESYLEYREIYDDYMKYNLGIRDGRYDFENLIAEGIFKEDEVIHNELPKQDKKMRYKFFDENSFIARKLVETLQKDFKGEFSQKLSEYYKIIERHEAKYPHKNGKSLLECFNEELNKAVLERAKNCEIKEIGVGKKFSSDNFINAVRKSQNDIKYENFLNRNIYLEVIKKELKNLDKMSLEEKSSLIVQLYSLGKAEEYENFNDINQSKKTISFEKNTPFTDETMKLIEKIVNSCDEKELKYGKIFKVTGGNSFNLPNNRKFMKAVYQPKKIILEKDLAQFLKDNGVIKSLDDFSMETFYLKNKFETDQLIQKNVDEYFEINEKIPHSGFLPNREVKFTGIRKVLKISDSTTKQKVLDALMENPKNKDTFLKMYKSLLYKKLNPYSDTEKKLIDLRQDISKVLDCYASKEKEEIDKQNVYRRFTNLSSLDENRPKNSDYMENLINDNLKECLDYSLEKCAYSDCYESMKKDCELVKRIIDSNNKKEYQKYISQKNLNMDKTNSYVLYSVLELIRIKERNPNLSSNIDDIIKNISIKKELNLYETHNGEEVFSQKNLDKLLSISENLTNSENLDVFEKALQYDDTEREKCNSFDEPPFEGELLDQEVDSLNRYVDRMVDYGLSIADIEENLVDRFSGTRPEIRYNYCLKLKEKIEKSPKEIENIELYKEILGKVEGINNNINNNPVLNFSDDNVFKANSRISQVFKEDLKDIKFKFIGSHTKAMMTLYEESDMHPKEVDKFISETLMQMQNFANTRTLGKDLIVLNDLLRMYQEPDISGYSQKQRNFFDEIESYSLNEKIDETTQLDRIEKLFVVGTVLNNRRNINPLEIKAAYKLMGTLGLDYNEYVSDSGNFDTSKLEELYEGKKSKCIEADNRNRVTLSNYLKHQVEDGLFNSEYDCGIEGLDLNSFENATHEEVQNMQREVGTERD